MSTKHISAVSPQRSSSSSVVDPLIVLSPSHSLSSFPYPPHSLSFSFLFIILSFVSFSSSLSPFPHLYLLFIYASIPLSFSAISSHYNCHILYQGLFLFPLFPSYFSSSSESFLSFPYKDYKQ